MRSEMVSLSSGKIDYCTNLSIGQFPERVKIAPPIGINTATMKTQIARILPNFRVGPSILLVEKRTKYPMTAKVVAGIKLIRKHISTPPFSERICHSRSICQPE